MSQYDKDVEALYKGELRFIDVPFPEDPDWEKEPSYNHQYRNYHDLYRTGMPKVPALFTHCEVSRVENEVAASVRIYYRSMVLKPKKWVMFKDINGMEPILTDEIDGENTKTVGAEAGYGPVKASTEFKTSVGVEYEKKVTVLTKYRNSNLEPSINPH
ncbi:hypothetical protein BGX26_008672 [Mortierella sp. AD094]|nr:hypothetical protein BGX26_008672 [Mortierella sp. AD094]